MTSMTKKTESAKRIPITHPAANSVSRIDLVCWMSGTIAGEALTAAAGGAPGVALVLTVCPNNGVPIAAATSGSRIFMPKVF